MARRTGVSGSGFVDDSARLYGRNQSYAKSILDDA
jgi:hypothetical protein